MLAADEARQPAVPHGLHAERDREMGLAHARAPDGYRVLVPVHEAERGVVLDLRPGHARLEGPVGVLERLHIGEARLPCLAADDALAPEPRLVGGHPGQRLRERPAAVCHHGHVFGRVGCHRAGPELLEVAYDARIGRGGGISACVLSLIIVTGFVLLFFATKGQYSLLWGRRGGSCLV